jgi:hypothetical protein
MMQIKALVAHVRDTISANWPQVADVLQLPANNVSRVVM